MGPPNKQDLAFLQTWMKAPSMGNVYLLGADSDVWETFDPSELVCLRPKKGDSCFNRFFANSLVRWYHHLIGHRFTVPSLSLSVSLSFSHSLPTSHLSTPFPLRCE